MAIDSSDFKPIREHRNQVYVIKWELIVFTKLIVVNKAWLCHFEEYSLCSVSDVRPVCTAECRASLVKVKLIRYLGRPPKGQTEGTIYLDDPHFTLWLHLYMLTDIHSPLPDCNIRNVDMQGDTIDVYSLPIRRHRQHCLRAVCDALIEVIFPPSHPAHHEGSVHDRYIDRVYYESIGGFDEDGDCSFASHTSAHNLIGNHIKWLRANIYTLTCELESYAKESDGFIIINLPLQFREQLSAQWGREAHSEC
jgi:hypothetical protein